MMTLSKYLCNASTVGDWHGQEQRAADNINRIYHALDECLFHILVMGDEEHYHPEIYDAVMSRVWDDWKSNTALLNLTQAAMEKYIQARTLAYTLPLQGGLRSQPGGTGITF